MKNTRVKTYALMTVALALLCMPLQIEASNVSPILNPDSNVALAKDNLQGGWTYTVEGASDGFEKGFLLIVKQDGVFKVQVQTAGMTLMGENVATKKNTITFDVKIEGQTYAVKLTADGSKISGTSTGQDGVFAINGVKSLSAGQ